MHSLPPRNVLEGGGAWDIFGLQGDLATKGGGWEIFGLQGSWPQGGTFIFREGGGGDTLIPTMKFGVTF